jgi:hypothetical protein
MRLPTAVAPALLATIVFGTWPMNAQAQDFN